MQCEGVTRAGVRCRKTCQEGKTRCHVHENDHEEPCSVCMLRMSGGEGDRTLDCGHTFHVRCLERWKRRSSTCPLCRTPFDQPMYRVKITIEPTGYEHEMVTSNVQSLVDMFGLDTSVQNFFSTIRFAVMNEPDLRTILDELGFPLGSGNEVPSVNLSSTNTEG